MDREECYINKLLAARRIGLLAETHDVFLEKLGDMSDLEEWPTRDLEAAYVKLNEAFMEVIEEESRYLLRTVGQEVCQSEITEEEINYLQEIAGQEAINRFCNEADKLERSPLSASERAFLLAIELVMGKISKF